MGRIDTETKAFMSDPSRFADAFNYLIYDGQPVIRPENLKPLDTTEITIPYGNNARVPEQKYRDVLKLLSVMRDHEAIYAVLGVENQTNVIGNVLNIFRFSCCPQAIVLRQIS